MSAHQRRKGRNGELEVQKRLNELLIGADAVLLYDQPEAGGLRGDVQSTVGNFEVKRRASLPAWMQLHDGVRGVYVRRDRGEWMVLVRAGDFEDLIQDRFSLNKIAMDYGDEWKRMYEVVAAENARLRETGGKLRNSLYMDAYGAEAARAWDEEVGK